MYKLCFYVPESHLEAVKLALFDAGAGRQGDYDQCCWQNLGEGQFRPLAGSKPYLGQAHRLSRVPEYKVEMLCEEKIIEKVLAALRKSHPYEEPAYDVIRLESI
ncbi:MAG TPA: NGG1p interacting factor NIF3 [Porticoccaceae bacterium]|nr:NGG1p interacting factor NIF3 [Porticoccaceae bacterium]HCO60277.1 NGG1p interacting factor NIF3 [Porticoccaceae bacterium]